MVTKIDIKMQMRNQCYTPLAKNQYYIDKTNTLEKGIAEFPSIYMEGAAACGKTTAMKMLLEKHPEVSPFVIWMDEELKKPSKLLEKLEQIKENAYQADAAWMIFENFHALEQCADSNIRTQIITAIAAWIFHLPENQRIVLISREKPAAELLELFWKRKMEIFSQETFLFTKEEIRKFAEYTETMLNPEEIYAEIGGWAGCVDVLIRLSGKFTETFEKKSGKFPEMKTVKNINIEFMRMIGIDGRRLLEELRENSSDTVPIMYSGLEKIEIIDIPMHSPLKVGKEYTFEFRCSSWRILAIINGNTWHRNWDRTARKNGIFKMTVTITEPGPVMLAYNTDGSSYNFLLEYTAEE